MKKFTYLVLFHLFIFSGDLVAQKRSYSTADGKTKIVVDNNKYGLTDINGNTIIMCQYDDISSLGFQEGLLAVCKDKKWGFVNEKGEVVIPLQYKHVESFSEGLAPVTYNGYYAKGWGYINKKGEKVIPFKYNNAYPFHDGMAKVGTGRDNNGLFFVGLFTYFIPCIGYLFVKPHRYGYINTSGQEVIPIQYRDAENFDNGVAKVQVKKKRYGYVDKAGNVYDTEDQALYAVHGTLDGIKKSGGVLAGNNVSAEDKFFDENKERIIAKKRSSLVSSSDETSQIIPITDNNTTNQPTRPQQGISSQQAESPSPESVETPSDVDLNIPRAHTTANENTFVVIIANEAYRREAFVEFAGRDGEMFKQYCLQTLGIPQGNVHHVKNATLNDMRAEVDWISKVANVYGGDAKIIFYYAGHGVPDEKTRSAFLLPTDGYGNNAETGYKLSDLYAKLSAHPARSILVLLDACFSGSERGDKMLASARGIAIKAKADVPTGNMVVFSAASGDESAYPYREKNHGMFTYFLLKKLQESRGETTLGELADFISKQVSRRSIVDNAKSQTPTITAYPKLGEQWKNWKLK